MIGIFRKHNPFSIILLFFYGLILRFASFLSPGGRPVSGPSDGYLYRVMVQLLEGPGTATPLLYPMITYLLVFAQAVMLNQIMVGEKIMSRQSYLPAMAYLMVSALFPAWFALSAALMANTLLIPAWGNMTRLMNNRRAGPLLFNTGMLLGLATFFYVPSLGLVLLMYVAILIMGPFRLADWLIGLIGFLVPFYFLFSYLYLTSGWKPGMLIPAMRFHLPVIMQSPQTWGAVVLLVFPILWGSYFINKQLFRMLIKSRKGWSLLFSYMFLALCVPLFGSTGHLTGWLLGVPAFAAFHANAYLQPVKRLWPNLLHWLVFLFILLVNISQMQA